MRTSSSVYVCAPRLACLSFPAPLHSLPLCLSVALSLLLCPSGLTLVYWCASCVSNGYKIVFAPGTLSALCKVKCNKHYEKSHHSLHRFNPILTLCLSLLLWLLFHFLFYSYQKFAMKAAWYCTVIFPVKFHNKISMETLIRIAFDSQNAIDIN